MTAYLILARKFLSSIFPCRQECPQVLNLVQRKLKHEDESY